MLSSLLRSTSAMVASRSAVQRTTSYAVPIATRSLSTHVAFRPSPPARSAVKPGSESEATTPGAGSTEEIANSEGAYDGSKTNPDSSASQIENETSANFDTSSANAESSEMATKSQHQSDRRPSKQQQKRPDRTDLGATEARKQGGRGGQRSH